MPVSQEAGSSAGRATAGAAPGPLNMGEGAGDGAAPPAGAPKSEAGAWGGGADWKPAAGAGAPKSDGGAAGASAAGAGAGAGAGALAGGFAGAGGGMVSNCAAAGPARTSPAISPKSWSARIGACLETRIALVPDTFASFIARWLPPHKLGRIRSQKRCFGGGLPPAAPAG